MAPSGETVAILVEDPDLGWAVEPATLPVTKRELRAQAHRLPSGAWSPPVAGLENARDTLGLLVLEGLLTREVLLAGRTSLELLGPGDLLRPWQPHDEDLGHVP